MADSSFWVQAAERFRRLQPPGPERGEPQRASHNGLCAWWNPEEWDSGEPYKFFNDGHDLEANQNIERLFRITAESAAVEMGHAPGEAAVFAWLDRLRLSGLYVQAFVDDTQIMHRICDTSAEYCVICEGEAKAAIRDAPTSVTGAVNDQQAQIAEREAKDYKTRLGRNIDRLRKECGWSFDELANQTKIEKKLTLGHVNDGKGAHPRTLKIYADAFAQELGRPVSIAELESGPQK
jgi:hypothetical protein